MSVSVGVVDGMGVNVEVGNGVPVGTIVAAGAQDARIKTKSKVVMGNLVFIGTELNLHDTDLIGMSECTMLILGLFLYGTVGTLKISPTTYPASALTVPMTAISKPLRNGLPIVTRAL